MILKYSDKGCGRFYHNNKNNYLIAYFGKWLRITIGSKNNLN